MTGPLLPYSQLVYDLEQLVPGIYNIPFAVCFDKLVYTKSQIETAIQTTIANHPAFALRDDRGKPYYDYQLEETDKGIELSGYVNRILGDGQSLALFIDNLGRALRLESLVSDPYDAYMRHYLSFCQSPRYEANRQWLAEQFGSISCPVHPSTDVPLHSVEVPQGGEFFSSYGAYMHHLTTVAEAHHITMDAFWCLCVMLAMMDLESTDEAALTWAYEGRETEEEQAVFGSLHRDVPLKLSRSANPEDLFRQIRNQMRSGIAHSSYPWTLIAPQSQVWNYAVNVLRQPTLPVIAHTCAIPLPPSIAHLCAISYALLDIEIEDDGLRFKYSASHYKQETIERFARRIRYYADWLYIAHTCAIPPLDMAHECAISSRLEANRIANPDRRTNPVQSIEDLYRYAAHFLTSMPWEGLELGEEESVFHRIDQSIGYFYYLFGPLQTDPVIAAWLTAYDTAWGRWLSSPASWNQDACMRLLSQDPLFELNTGRYEDASHWHCWNDFFARRLVSPIAHSCAINPLPSPITRAILSPCDGIVMHKPVKTATIDRWIDLLADSPYRDDFVNADTFHIVLDMYNYHRFHAPVSGKIVDLRFVDGVHNAGGTIIWDKEQDRYRYETLNNENFQMLEKRGVIVIDSPEWGRVAMVSVGVAQVSSVNWLPELAIGTEVTAGQELGYFLCGGSDVVLFFEKKIRYVATLGDLLHVGQPIASLYNNAHACASKPYLDENGQWKRPVNPNKQHRTLDHDYQQPGTYMITLSTYDRKPLLGRLVWSDSEGRDAKVELSELGKQVEEQWQNLSSLHPELEVQDYQLMPDHLHGLLWVKEPLDKPLGQYIRGFKIGTTHLYSASMRYHPLSLTHSASMRYNPGYASLDANQRQQVAAQSLWESNYNDRIAYSSARLEVLQRYIHDNPYRLAQKRIHPDLFTLRRNVTIAGLTFSALGNRFLLEKPLRQVIQCSRSFTAQDIHSACMRYTLSAEEGFVHISGAISKGEQECCKQLRELGYPLVILLKDGFPKPDDPHARFYKPGGVYFEACARGQLLLLEPTEETWNLPFIAEVVYHKSPFAPSSSDRYRFLANNEIARILCL